MGREPVSKQAWNKEVGIEGGDVDETVCSRETLRMRVAYDARVRHQLSPGKISI